VFVCASESRLADGGPVFRAENSNTHRHLTEFIGLDLEMVFESHYEEIMYLIDGMFKHIFRSLQTQHRDEVCPLAFGSGSRAGG
jgi:aspartyl/asparaginyl-tRNA synthetase